MNEPAEPAIEPATDASGSPVGLEPAPANRPGASPDDSGDESDTADLFVQGGE